MVEGRLCPPAESEAGIALVVTLLVSALLTSLAATVALVVDVETTIAVNHRDGVSARHAAESALEFAVAELAQVADWTPVLNGTHVSGLAGAPVLPASHGGAPVDLPGLTASVQRVTYGSGVWGASTPEWRVFAHGVPVRDLPFSGWTTDAFVLVWVSDDVADSDGDPAADSNAVLVVRARAFGRRRSRVDVQALLARVSPGIVRRVSSRVML